MLTVTVNGTIVDCHIPDQAILFSERKSVINHNLKDVFPREIAIKGLETMYDSLASGNVSVFEFELASSTKTEYYETRVCAIDHEKSVFIIRDITETKRLQNLESRALRLESAGSLAGQVAHDFNNLLGPLMAYPEFIKDELGEDHPAMEYISSIEKATAQIADINQQLLTLSRRGHYSLNVVNLNDLLKSVINQVQPDFKKITIALDLEENLMNVKAGQSQLYRVFLNLLTNAYDAMNGKGKLKVKTENYYIDDDRTRYNKIPRGEYVKVSISDTGSGINQNVVDKIFEPFFTTKVSNKKRGSGLGLSVVDGVIKDHNGHIDLVTSPKGTTFYIYLPMTREDIKEAHVTPLQMGNNEKVLVVDDDEIQREVSLKLLKRLGYQAKTVTSGERAVEYLKNNKVDLILLDMIMPLGMDGAETYQEIKRMYPNQRALIVSGYSESAKVNKAQILGAGAYVKKPLTINALAKAIKEELNKEKSKK